MGHTSTAVLCIELERTGKYRMHTAIRFLQTSSVYLSVTQRLYCASVVWQNVSSVKLIMWFVAQKMI